jgi:hypothetical protein
MDDVDINQGTAAEHLEDEADQFLKLARRFAPHWSIWGDHVKEKRQRDLLADSQAGFSDNPQEEDRDMARLHQAGPRRLYANMETEDEAFWNNQAELQKYARKRL